MRSMSAQACLGFHLGEVLASMLYLKQLTGSEAGNSTVIGLSSPFVGGRRDPGTNLQPPTPNIQEASRSNLQTVSRRLLVNRP